MFAKEKFNIVFQNHLKYYPVFIMISDYLNNHSTLSFCISEQSYFNRDETIFTYFCLLWPNLRNNNHQRYQLQLYLDYWKKAYPKTSILTARSPWVNILFHIMVSQKYGVYVFEDYLGYPFAGSWWRSIGELLVEDFYKKIIQPWWEQWVEEKAFFYIVLWKNQVSKWMRSVKDIIILFLTHNKSETEIQ